MLSNDKLLSIIAEEAHLEFVEHADSESSLSRDCERCRDFALRLMVRLAGTELYHSEQLSFTRERVVN